MKEVVRRVRVVLQSDDVASAEDMKTSPLALKMLNVFKPSQIPTAIRGDW